MATTNIIVRHRPNRIGFLVRPDELDDLVRAAGICNLLWGGVRNPIIPVCAAIDAKADQLLRMFQVDALFPVAQTDAINKFLERYPYLQNPRLHAREIFYEDWHTKKLKVAYLDVINAVEKYWSQEFKHAPSEHESACRLVTWDDSDRLRELFALSFGAYPSDLNLKDDFHTAFLKGLRAKEVHIDPHGNVSVELATAVTPLRLSGVDLQSRRCSFRTWEGGVYFGDPKNFADLTTFWNMRAGGDAVEFASLSDLGRLEDVVKEHFRRLDELPNRHPNIEAHISACYRDNHDAVLAALERFPTKKRKMLCQIIDVPGVEVGGQPALPYFDWDFALGLVEREAGGFSVTVTLPDKKFLVDSERQEDDQSLAVSVEAYSDFGYPDHTLAPPFRIELSEFYSREISIDPWTVKSEEEGIGVCITAGKKTLRLRPIKNSAVIEALLGQAGIKLRVSPGGRLADRLLEKLEGLEGTRVFKIRGVRQLVASLTSQAAIGRGGATNAIWNEGQFSQHEQLHIEARDTPKLTTDSTFDFLLRKDFFRAGLELKCDHCGLDSWLSLRQIDDEWICEFCGHRNATSLHIRHRGDWKFRKSGLLAKDNNQEGAIPVLLSLLVFARVFDSSKRLQMTSANVLEGAPECEIDFIVVHYGRGEISLAIGEAKSAGGKIDSDDVAHMKAVAGAVSSIGIRPYLVFSKTADSFSAQEIEMFRALRKEQHHVILLTNKEIEPYYPYIEGDDEDKLPQKYAHSFDDMVANTEYRYLRFPPVS
jgi:hypothetical protein